MKKRFGEILKIAIISLLISFFIVPTVSQTSVKAASYTEVNSCYCVNSTSGVPLKNSSGKVLATIPNGTYIYVIKISGNTGVTSYNHTLGYVDLTKTKREDDSPETVAELEKRLAAVMDMYPKDSTWYGSYMDKTDTYGRYYANNGTAQVFQCFGFAREVFRALYGCEMSDTKYSNTPYILKPDSDMTLIQTLNGSGKNGVKAYTANDVKNLCLKAKTGDILVGSSSPTSSHLMIVYKVTSKSIFIYDANLFYEDNIIKITEYTWEKLLNNRAYGLSLYRYTYYPPDTPQQIVDSAIVTQNTSGTATTQFYLGDKITLKTDVKNARTVTFYICNKADNKVVFSQKCELGIYSTGNTTTSYTMSALTNSSNDYYSYYVAENSKYKTTSAKTYFKVLSPSISTSVSEMKLDVGKTSTISVTKAPTTGTVTWSSNNTKVATVSTSGVVTAKAEGTATITATFSYKGTGGITTKLTAKVTVSVYQPTVVVKFDSRGGSSVSNKNVTKTKTYGTLTTPTRTGYTFAGWYTAASGGTKIVSTSVVTTTASTQTLYAQWTANTYKLTYNANGGTTSVASKNVTYDSTYGDLAVPTRTGYTFVGWFTAASGGTQILKTTTVKTAAAQTVYAHWSANAVKVNFNSNGGSAVTSVNVTFDSPYGALEVPTKTGYDFAGWYTAASGGTKYTETTKVTNAKEHTLYAHWTASKYTVTLNMHDGTDTTQTKTVTYNSTYGTLPTPVNPGYKFGGWWTGIVGGKRIYSGTTVTTAGDHTLYARWDYGSFTITLDANGGECIATSIERQYLEPYGELPSPTRKGYTFKGWYEPAVGDEEPLLIDPLLSFSFEADSTIVALWEVNSYTVELNTNTTESSFNNKIVQYETALGTLETPERMGYTFGGWYCGDTLVTSETVFDDTLVTSDVVLNGEENLVIYAKWDANEYEVKLDANDGMLALDRVRILFNDYYGSLPEPTRRGYDFDGWYTAKSHGNKITEESTMQSVGGATLYAIWIPKVTTVTFDVDNGTVEFAAKDITYDEDYGALPVATRIGYEFGGWRNSEDVVVTARTKVQTEVNTVLTAIWTANQYTVDFDMNGGLCSTPATQLTLTYDSNYPILPTPSLTGFRFLGWKTADGIHVLSGDAVNITANQTLVADWAPLMLVIRLNADGGDISVLTKKVMYGETVGELPTPIKTGYMFVGWYDAQKTLYQAETVVDLVSDIDLTAVWLPITYQLSFDANGGVVAEVSRTVFYDQAFGTLPVPLRMGYNFLRWVKDDGTEICATDIVDLTEDAKLTAVWAAVDYYVSFDANGADFVLPARMVTYLTSIGKLPEIKRDGYIFKGWFVGDESISDDAVMTYTSNITVTAKWETIDYTITLDPNGGDCDIDTLVFTCDDLYRFPIVKKQGYEFVGWFDENGNMVAESSPVQPIENQNYHAEWTPFEYNIFFSFNGNIDASLTMTVHYGELVENLSEFPYEGYTFTRWQMSDGTVLEEGKPYLLTSDVVLYAVAKANTYRVSFDTNGGDPKPNSIVVTYNEKIGTLPEVIRRGYVFKGWKTEEGNRITENTTVRFAENLTLVADWAEIVSDNQEVINDNSLIVTGFEVIAGVNIVLLTIAGIRRRKFKKRKTDNDDLQ